MRPFMAAVIGVLTVIAMGNGAAGGAIYSADATTDVMGMLINALTKQDEEPAATVFVFSGEAVG